MRASRRLDRTSPMSWRTFVLFALAVILPGFVLSALGIITLRQDRSLADQQVRERRDVLADRAVASLETELRGWTSALAAFPLQSSPDPLMFRPLIRAALERSDLSVCVMSGPSGTRVWPDRRLLYEVAASDARPLAPLPVVPALAAAERIELEQRDLVRAAAAYRALAATADPAARADVLVRLARTYRNSGREDLAASAYRDLERLAGTSVNGVPAGLLATCALCVVAPAQQRDACALPIYRDLVDGRWRLDRTWYWAYSGQVRGLFSGSAARSAEVEKLAAREEEKRSLSRAVEAIVSEPRAGGAPASTRMLQVDDRVFLVFTSVSSGHLRAIVLSSSTLSQHVWPAVFAQLLAEVTITLADSNGTRLFASIEDGAPPPPDARLATARLVHHAGLTWKIDVRLRHPDVLLSGFQRRQWLYVAMLLVMAASLVVGTTLTLRTVSRELAVARLKSQFVSAVSHEFRTPLTGIRHYGEMLLHDRVATEDRKHHYYAQVVAAAERLSRLVEDVLDFARMEEGRQQYQFENIETTAWLRQTVAEFQATLGQDKRLESAIPDALAFIRGDRSALARAIHNLLDNAVKYSPDCDTVWIDASQNGAGLCVSVRDKGVGIPVSDRPYVFDRFFRGRALDGPARGTGLGLSLVQHIVSAHGGTIDVANAGQPIRLTATEFKILRTLYQSRGKVVTIDQLLQRVWGADVFLTDRVIYTHVNNLRSKIEPDPATPRIVVGVRGLGYRFDG
ncbi:MAG: winged helix-turn-helix domain-containing protein [Acidobacteria bacterium]|nr:winged helix-turn-helix domain-containing protein [Acidobacteriota bacterium]